ncbi:MAG: hypothetical protein NVS1B13_16550 [Flavisolibacter sp.]
MVQILMYVPHYGDRDFSYLNNSTLEHNLRLAPILARSFIKKFFKREFSVEEIDFKDVEINRIDVCFNQVFKSAEETIAYFNYQMKIKKKYSKEQNEGKIQYKTSFMYKTKRYSFKIYQKGAEYRENDSKQHKRINKEKGYNYFDIPALQNFADRIIRYELTVRNTEFNYLYKRNLFRRSDKIWLRRYKEYKRIENIKVRNDKKSKQIGLLPERDKEQYRINYPYERITRQESALHKEIGKIINAQPSFRFEISPDDEMYNLEMVPFHSDKAKFSQNLIKLILNKLVKSINEFKIKALPDIARIAIEIDKANSKRVKNKLPKKEMLDFYEKLVQFGSFKEVRKECRMSKATFFRYKARFKLIGITDKNVRPNKEYTFPSAPLDFQLYHSYLKNNNLVKGIKIY